MGRFNKEIKKYKDITKGKKVFKEYKAIND